MREIKFRAKTKANGHWVVGSYIHDDNCPTIRVFGGGEPFVVPNTITQYTGLKDRDGKEIYEGDVIMTRSKHLEWVDYWVVFWNAERGAWWVKGYGVDESLAGRMDEFVGEVVANIYDNSEWAQEENEKFRK